jgi:hypothetical protein
MSSDYQRQKESGMLKGASKAENEQCPVCGYYCLGKGGVGCIDKPSLVEQEEKIEDAFRKAIMSPAGPWRRGDSAKKEER